MGVGKSSIFTIATPNDAVLPEPEKARRSSKRHKTKTKTVEARREGTAIVKGRKCPPPLPSLPRDSTGAVGGKRVVHPHPLGQKKKEKKSKNLLCAAEATTTVRPPICAFGLWWKMSDHVVLSVDRLVRLVPARDEAEASSSSSSSGGGEAAEVEENEKEEEEAPLIQMAECRICQDEDSVSNLESPCACSGSLKYAHRKCIQHWCNEKGDITCEICHQV
ncbi:hypothetical protein EUGRSUZ_C00071 [Eucalyptus grandis]|uniref:RING-CH-type domain-containing protein n=2 Tax=Eucalyptus grandis TaxID=71139 RepID=A0A059CK51_EUCGR|nr:hypothetical protein EUGRSUZ_C00071 [Eucalyptus grandis]